MCIFPTGEEKISVPKHQEMKRIQSVSGGKVSILGGHSIGHSKQENIYVLRTVSEIELFHCTDEQHAMFSHELQSALMVTVEFSKMYYTR
jgi:hypothetical protein